MLHYEGERGAERMVRAAFADGQVHHFEGESGAGRMVRAEIPDGRVHHYEGERGAERVVRTDASTDASTDATPAYLCSVCMEDKLPTLTMLLPCTHTLCAQCAVTIERCPMCRAPTRGKISVLV